MQNMWLEEKGLPIDSKFNKPLATVMIKGDYDRDVEYSCVFRELIQ